MKYSHQPLLIIMQGLSGSGKTTASLLLARVLNAEVLRTDVERKRLFGLQAHDSSQKAGLDIYTQEANQKTYAYLQQKAGELLIQGKTVILDGAFLKETERSQYSQTAEQLGFSYLIVKCMAPDSVLKHRIRKRQSNSNDASEAFPALIEQQKRWEEPVKPSEIEHTVVIDTSLTGWKTQLIDHITSRTH